MLVWNYSISNEGARRHFLLHRAIDRFEELFLRKTAAWMDWLSRDP
jgi:hypothetical protein